MTITLIGKCSKILGPPQKYVPWCWWGAKRSIKSTQNRERALPLAPVEILYIFHIKTVFHVHMCILYFFLIPHYICSILSYHIVYRYTDTPVYWKIVNKEFNLWQCLAWKLAFKSSEQMRGRYISNFQTWENLHVCTACRSFWPKSISY